MRQGRVKIRHVRAPLYGKRVLLCVHPVQIQRKTTATLLCTAAIVHNTPPSAKSRSTSSDTKPVAVSRCVCAASGGRFLNWWILEKRRRFSSIFHLPDRKEKYSVTKLKATDGRVDGCCSNVENASHHDEERERRVAVVVVMP